MLLLFNLKLLTNPQLSQSVGVLFTRYTILVILWLNMETWPAVTDFCCVL